MPSSGQTQVLLIKSAVSEKQFIERGKTFKKPQLNPFALKV